MILIPAITWGDYIENFQLGMSFNPLNRAEIVLLAETELKFGRGKISARNEAIFRFISSCES